MSAHAIWDWANRASEAMQRRQRARELRASIASFTCGNCHHWMTRQCPRERNVNGWNKGPSMDDDRCEKFEEKESSKTFRTKQREELATITP